MTANRTACAGTVLLQKNQTTPIAITDYFPNEMHFYLIEWSYQGKEGKNYYVSGNAPYSFDDYEKYMKQSGMWEADGLN